MNFKPRGLVSIVVRPIDGESATSWCWGDFIGGKPRVGIANPGLKGVTPLVLDQPTIPDRGSTDEHALTRGDNLSHLSGGRL